MSGALAERVFAHKLTKVGFSAIEVLDRQPFGLADVERYPLFTPALVELMRHLLPAEQHREVAVAVTFTARRPAVSKQ